jgi:hypothetical protein
MGGGAQELSAVESKFDASESARKISALAKDFLHDPSENPDANSAAFTMELKKVFADPAQAEAVAARLLKDNWNLDTLPYTNVVRSPWTKEITGVEFVPANLDFSAQRYSAYFPVREAIDREQRALAAIGMSARFDLFGHIFEAR